MTKHTRTPHSNAYTRQAAIVWTAILAVGCALQIFLALALRSEMAIEFSPMVVLPTLALWVAAVIGVLIWLGVSLKRRTHSWLQLGCFIAAVGGATASCWAFINWAEAIASV
jgi:hypothetical protein